MFASYESVNKYFTVLFLNEKIFATENPYSLKLVSIVK